MSLRDSGAMGERLTLVIRDGKTGKVKRRVEAGDEPSNKDINDLLAMLETERFALSGMSVVTWGVFRMIPALAWSRT